MVAMTIIRPETLVYHAATLVHLRIARLGACRERPSRAKRLPQPGDVKISDPVWVGAMDWRPAHGAGPSPFSVPYHALNPVERRIAIRFAPAPQLEGDLANLLHLSHLHRSSTPQERPAERRCPAKFLSLGLNVPRA